MQIFSATYDPDDNKLRLYSDSRLSPELYARVRAAGFIWAAKQQLFVAPMWTPERADLLMELAGEIDDEDTSLADRAGVRADRFDVYADHRESDALDAEAAVARLADNIPLGQSILVGHHSEKMARRNAARIESGMQKAVKMWETAAYWSERANGVIKNAQYKERPDVRARRIKTIEADKRRAERDLAAANKGIKFWTGGMKLKSGEPFVLTRELALHFCNYYERGHYCFTLAEYPRCEPASQYEGPRSLYSALVDNIISVEVAKSLALAAHEKMIDFCNRWIQHYTFRLSYENALLAAAGYKEPEKKKSKKATLPLLNYRAENITCESPYRKEEMTLTVIEMTKEYYASIPVDYKSTVAVNGNHRYRVAMVRHDKNYPTLAAVFLVDSKFSPRPEEGVAHE